MRKGIRITMIIAGSMMGLGLVIGLIGASMNNFQFDAVQSTEYVRQESAFEEKLEEIRAYTLSDDIIIKKSEDNQTRITYYNSKDERIFYQLDVAEDKDAKVLTIEQKDDRKWYEHIFVFHIRQDKSLTIYLPEESYRSLTLKSTSGKVDCRTNLQVKENMKAASVSDDIKIQQMSCRGTVDLNCTSGDIEIDEMQAEVLNAASVSGDIKLSNVHTKGAVSVKTVSGDVKLKTVESSGIEAKTTSGSIKGTIGYQGTYHCNTVSGKISVPDNDAASKREYTFKSVSGDIKINA